MATTFVITGTSGAGKTAFLNAVSRTCAALDLDVVGVHYQDDWINIPILIKCAQLQGFQWFGGVFKPSTFDALADKGVDLRIIYLEPDPSALDRRNATRKKLGQPIRWSYDKEKVEAEFKDLAKWAKDRKFGLWRAERIVDMARDDKKEGSADDSSLKKWRAIFPCPFSIGWNQSGSDPELDALLTQWFALLYKHESSMLKFAIRYSGDFSRSRWRQFCDVYAPDLGALMPQIWDLAVKKGFEQKRRAQIMSDEA